MKAVILAGGKGTRLRPLTFSIPKPLLPIGETPIIDVALKALKNYGVKEVFISIGYHGEIIKAFCGDGSKYGLSISYYCEDKPLGTAGPLSLMYKAFSKDDVFILMNGDIYTDLNFQELIGFHKNGEYALTIAYKEFEYQSPYGTLSFKNNRLSKIIEKPKTLYNISSGIYILNASVIDNIPQNEFYTVPELINVLLENKEEVGVFKINEFWWSIEQIHDFEKVLTEIKKVRV